MPQFNLTIATPTGSGDTTIFDTTTMFGGAGMIQNMGIARIAFSVEHNQAGTLTAYRSSDRGVNWDAYDVQTVGIPAANQISGPFDYVIDHHGDWKLVWTNGGTNQTVWRPYVTFTEQDW